MHIFFDIGDTIIDAKTFTWRPGAQQLLERLQKLHPLGVISNTGQLTRDELLKKLPSDFIGHFQPNLIILSIEAGHSKPGPEIFQKAIQAAAQPPAACLYCSENPVEIQAAKSLGMQTVLAQGDLLDLSFEPSSPACS